jgi:hypothetical protein
LTNPEIWRKEMLELKNVSYQVQDEKSEKARLFLARLKFDSSDYNDQPYTYMAQRIREFNSSEYYQLMFIHIREPQEIERVKNDFNCKTILVKNIHVEDIKSNDADANVYNYQYDYTIENNGDLDSLMLSAHKFVLEVMNE